MQTRQLDSRHSKWSHHKTADCTDGVALMTCESRPLIVFLNTNHHTWACYVRFISPKKEIERNAPLWADADWMCVSVGQESRWSSSAARGCAPGSGAQGSSAQPGSVLQGERGSESKRRPSNRWIPTGSYCSGNLRRIREYHCLYQILEFWGSSFPLRDPKWTFNTVN